MKCGMEEAAENCPKGLSECCYFCKYRNTDCDEYCQNFKTVDEAVQCKSLQKEEVQTLDQMIPDVLKQMTDRLLLDKKIQEQIKLDKEKVLAAMEKGWVKKWTSLDGSVSITYIEAHTRDGGIDAKKLKINYPEAYESCHKDPTEVKASIMVKVK